MRRVVGVVLAVLIWLAWPSAGHANGTTRSAPRGTIVVGGNELPTVESLTVVGDKIYVGDIQVWPAVNRRQPDPAPALPVTTQVTSQHELNLAVRARERELMAAGRQTTDIAIELVAMLRQHSNLVSDAWSEGSNAIKIRWLSGQVEEFLLDTRSTVTTTPEQAARERRELWEDCLKRGSTIYVGDGYVWYVPAIQRKETRQRLSRALAGSSANGDRRQQAFEGKYVEIIRDLRFPQPLDSLRTRR